MSNHKKAFVISCIAMTVIVATGIFFAYAEPGPNRNAAGGTAAQPKADASGSVGGAGPEKVVLKADEFAGGKAKFYFREISGKKVRFFVLKSSDGVIRAAFDACDVCYRAKKGYRQSDDLMICNNCGQRFASIRINEEKGGCNPSPLERTIEGGNVIITMDALSSGLYLF